jgi:hypothetical protein
MSLDNGPFPLVPPLDELEKLFVRSPDAAKEYIDYWLVKRRAYDELAIERLKDEIAGNRHKRCASICVIDGRRLWNLFKG